MMHTKNLDLFAGIPIADYAAALEWYERLLGSPPTFFPNDIEAVWELAEHRYVYIELRPEHAGHAMHTIFVDDLDAIVAQIADRGLDPVERETTRTACARSHTVISMEMRSGSAALRCNRLLAKAVAGHACRATGLFIASCCQQQHPPIVTYSSGEKGLFERMHPNMKTFRVSTVVFRQV